MSSRRMRVAQLEKISPDHAAGEFEDGAGLVLDVDVIGPVLLVPALRLRGPHVAGERGRRAEQVVDDVAPVREHIEHQPAAGRFPVVPGGALRRDMLAVEDPPAEFQLHRQQLAEAAEVQHGLQLGQARQVDLVLHDGVLGAGGLGIGAQGDHLGQRLGDRLLQIDMLAGGQRPAGQLGPAAAEGAFEEELVLRVGQRRIEVRRPAGDAEALGQRLQLVGGAADQDGVGHQPVAIGQRQPALGADRQQAVHQVLRGADAAGGTMHDDADAARGHGSCESPALLRPV